MSAYAPSPAFARVVRTELVSSLPFVARMAVKLIPDSAKDFAIVHALTQVMPLSFGTIASTSRVGERITLTSCGDMTAKVKGGFLRRIALWLVAEESTNIILALHKEVMRLGHEEFTTESWQLAIENNEVVLHVLSTSFLRESSETVADLFLDSFESLKSIKDKVTCYFSEKK